MAKFDRKAHDEQLWEEFQNESGGSYDMEKFSEWYRKRLYSEKGRKLLESREKQKGIRLDGLLTLTTIGELCDKYLEILRSSSSPKEFSELVKKLEAAKSTQKTHELEKLIKEWGMASFLENVFQALKNTNNREFWKFVRRTSR